MVVGREVAVAASGASHRVTCPPAENGVGDACQGDYDKDNVADHLDNCPNNSMIFSTDFR